MANERGPVVAHRRPATDQPLTTRAESRPLFGTKIRSALDEIKELRARRRGGRRAQEPEQKPLFGNQIREARRELAESRARRQAAKGIARDG